MATICITAISINVTTSINGWFSAGRGMEDHGGMMCQTQQIKKLGSARTALFLATEAMELTPPLQ